MSRRMVILTEGQTDPHNAKTATSVIRYRPDEVVGLLDRSQMGKTAQQLLEVGGTLPVVGSLDELPQANTLLIGIAPRGGEMPDEWRPIILDAIGRRMEIVSGLHEFLSDDPHFAAAAQESGVRLTDVRKNQEHRIGKLDQFDPSCFRVHTIGSDCSVGKMVTAVEISESLQHDGYDCKFVATGQTGIMVEGDGCPIDCVVADFVNGAAEQLVLDNQHHEILLIEGQGSLVHPSYSAVTLGLLHGCAPHAMILCYEVGRTHINSLEHYAIPPLGDLKRIYELMASIMHPSRVIGISMNSRLVSREEADRERARLQDEFELPVCDIFRHGVDDLVDAIIKMKAELVA